MGVQGGDPVPVVDDDGVAVPAFPSGEGNDPVLCGRDGGTVWGTDVLSRVQSSCPADRVDAIAKGAGEFTFDGDDHGPWFGGWCGNHDHGTGWCRGLLVVGVACGSEGGCRVDGAVSSATGVHFKVQVDGCVFRKAAGVAHVAEELALFDAHAGLDACGDAGEVGVIEGGADVGFEPHAGAAKAAVVAEGAGHDGAVSYGDEVGSGWAEDVVAVVASSAGSGGTKVAACVSGEFWWADGAGPLASYPDATTGFWEAVLLDRGAGWLSPDGDLCP